MRREEKRERQRERDKKRKGVEKERLRSQQQRVELLQSCVDVFFLVFFFFFIRLEASSQLSHSSKIEKRNEEDVSSKAQEERDVLQL